MLYHYHSHVLRPTRLIVADGELKQEVLPRLSLLLRPFRPTSWASSTHAQTVLGLLRTASIWGRYHRQLVMISDGGTIAIDWWQGCDQEQGTPDRPVLVVLHGINGGSHEGYCKWACAAATKKGWRACVVNYRGCNGLPLTAPRGYAATMSNDIHVAIVSIKA